MFSFKSFKAFFFSYLVNLLYSEYIFAYGLGKYTIFFMWVANFFNIYWIFYHFTKNLLFHPCHIPKFHSCICFWVFHLVPYICTLIPIILLKVLMTGSMCSSICFLIFYFSVRFIISVLNSVEMLVGIRLQLHCIYRLNWRITDIFKILNLPIHERGIFLYVFGP